MHAFDVLGDPVRRRILELLAQREHASGEVVEVIAREYGITQSAVSQQLRVLRDSGFATVRAEGTRRLYSVDAKPLSQVDAWLGQFRRFWQQPLDALATEIARGRARRTSVTGATVRAKVQGSKHGHQEARHEKSRQQDARQEGSYREGSRQKARRQKAC